NFIFVSVSDAACNELRTRGGFRYVSQLTQEALEAWKADRAPFMTAAKLAPYRQRLAEIDADPVMTSIRIYIHPYRIKTIGEMCKQKRGKNRNAEEIFTYVSARDDDYYHRYRDVWIARRIRGASVPR